jgi:hypothetical protein
MGNTCLFSQDSDLRRAWAVMEENFNAWVR